VQAIELHERPATGGGRADRDGCKRLDSGTGLPEDCI
jgi:hypothetical protein